MSEMTASVALNLTGNFEQRADRYSRAMGNFSRQTNRQLGMVRRSARAVGRGLDRMGNRYTALITGAAGFGTLRSLTRMEERFTRLGIQAQRSEEEMERLRRTIFETARAPDIRVDPSEITSAIESIVEKTGDLEFARENIRNIGLAISATGAAGQNIGEIMAEFQKMDISESAEVLRVIDTLNQQGKQGAFTLQNLASLGPRVVTAYTAMGREGSGAIKEMGAALQVIRMGTGSSEQAATAFEALLRTLQNADKVKALQRGGIQVFDPEELEKGRQVLRPINELMVEIIQAVDGQTTRLSSVFDAEAMRSFNAAAGEFQRTGSVASLEKFMDVHGDGSATMTDSARAAGSMAGAMRSLGAAWNNFADDNLTDTVQSAADALNSLDPETVDRWLKIGGALVGIVGAAAAGRYVTKLGADLFEGGRRLMGRGRRGGGVAGALGGAVAGAAPVPVYVVNMPGGFGEGGRRRGGGRATGNSRRSNRVSNWRMARKAPSLRMLPTAGVGVLGTAGVAVTGAGAAGYGAGTMISDYLLTDQGPLGTETGRKIGDSIGEAVAKTLAFFGNDEAQRAVAINERRDAGTLKIEVNQDGRVTEVTPTRGNDGPDMEVERGMSYMMP
ncbi:phage tail tape measure protein [Marinobacter sp. OP 3.4]|uniref:phage tail tape measure protein n=1 Tax=Marinobacter sp. OP 3.4 TaxID=3076501 RepID=UPI002E1A4A50